MKKLIALFLCVLCALSALAGCGDKKSGKDTQSGKNNGSDYTDKISFTMTSLASLNGNTDGYDDNEIYNYIVERFNIEPEVWASGWDICGEKESMWLNSGTMPDVMLWASFSFASYFNAIDQELIQPLPEDWKERWPNLAYMTKVSGIEAALEVDGKTYAIPHAVFGNFYQSDPKVQHNAIAFRKDWAKQVGMENFADDNIVTLAELKEYLEKVNKAGLTKMNGLGGTSGNIQMIFALEAGIPCYQPFAKIDNKFVWLPNIDGTTDYIKTMQAWYENYLIDVDFYSQSATYYENAFKAGQIAAVVCGAGAANIADIRDGYTGNFPNTDAYGDISYALVSAEDGTVYSHAETNYWTTSVFNPETDTETMERILDVMDYVASKEGQITTLTGVKGMHWDYDDDGNPAIIEGAEDAEPCDTFIMFGYCDDDYSYSGLRADLDVRNAELAQKLQKIKANGTVFPYSVEYDIYTSDAKTNYSVPFGSKVTEIVCDKLDVDKEWKKLINDNKAMWEPLLKELNESIK